MITPPTPEKNREPIAPVKKEELILENERLLSFTHSSIEVPKMSHGLAAHVLGGTHVRNLSLRAEVLEGFSAKAFLAYFHDHLKTSQHKSLPSVQKMIQELESALVLEEQIQRLKKLLGPKNWEERTQKIAAYMVDMLKKIEIGQTQLVLGG